jgi:hypothetical protein
MNELGDDRKMPIIDDSDAETLQRRMHAVRHELDGDFQEISDRVREFGVWQCYVKKHPWVWLGTAAILGYLVIPRKRNSRGPGLSLATRETHFDSLPPISVSRPHQSVREVAVNLLGTAILRGVSMYIGNRVGQVLRNYHQSTQEDETS